MIVPTLFTFFWFSVFGDTALHAIMFDGYTHLIEQVQNNKAIALFKLFEHLPLSNITSFLAIVLIITFFVTSADSGALVVDSLASGGALQTPAWQRLFWAVAQGVLAAVLLLAGGLSALQTASITSALPFAIIMLIAAVGLWRALQIEGLREVSLHHHMNLGRHATSVDSDPQSWTRRLDALVNYPSEKDVRAFINHDVAESMAKVADALKDRNWPAEVHADPTMGRQRLTVIQGDHFAFEYEIRPVAHPKPDFLFPAITQPSGNDAYYRAEVFLRRGGRAYDVYGYSRSQLISDMLDQFEKYMHFIHSAPSVLPWNVVDDNADTSNNSKSP